MGNIEDKNSSDENMNFESLSLGTYSGNGFWFKIEHIEFEQNDENPENEIKPKNYMSLGQIWNKKGFVIGLCYTAEIVESDSYVEIM